MRRVFTALVIFLSLLVSQCVHSVELEATSAEARGCASREDCASCVRAPECGWCSIDKKCTPGNLEEPALVRGAPSKCIGHPRGWRYEEDSCLQSALRNLRTKSIHPDPLFKPDGKPINEYIPQLSELFPEPIEKHHGHKNASNITKVGNHTILGPDGKPLTKLQVEQLKIREKMVHDQLRLEAAKKVADMAAKAVEKAAKELNAIRAEQKKELEKRIAAEKAAATKAAADAKRAAAEVQKAKLDAQKLQSNSSSAAKPSKFIELESVTDPSGKQRRFRRRNARKHN